MSTLNRLTALLKPFRGRLLLFLLCMGVGSGCYLSLPLIVKNMADVVLKAGQPTIPVPLLLLLAGAIGLAGAANGASQLLIFDVAHRLTARLRKQYVDHLLWLPMEYHRQGRIGNLIDILTTSLTDIEWFIKNSIGNVFGITLIVAGGVVMMFILSWQLSLLLLLTILPCGLVLRALFRRARKLHQQRQAASGTLISHLHALLYGIEIVKAFNAEELEGARFQARQDDMLALQQRTARFLALVEPISVTLAVITFMLILLFGGSLLVSEELAPDKLIAFMLYLLIIMPQVRTISMLMSRWQLAGTALDRITAVLDAPPETDPPGARPLAQPVAGRIEFRHVGYNYGGRERAMDDVSLLIHPGERVGIVGESGAGKTTLFNLMLRFYRPQEGVIRIDDRDLATVTAASLRRTIAVVPQDIVLFDDTVMENVRYGRPGADDAAVMAACRAAQTEEFIRAMPDGYATRLGDRGLNLSAGQRQRLAIARALLKDAPILLLDEATSALDAVTERQLRDAMDVAMAGRTTIVIAHRLATVVHLPRLIVMRRGRLLDDGTHDELLARCETYRSLVATQLIREPARNKMTPGVADAGVPATRKEP